jgi:RNA polymerase sigma factor (sigma-70 family)
MAANEGTEDPGCVGAFNTTHWSVVLAAGQAESSQSTAALEKLCRAYWYPLYMYVRRQGNSPEDAQDLTQDFFSRLLAKNYLAKADRERGKFRTFLLGSLKNFTINEWKRAGRLKRGGGLEILSIDAAHAEERYLAEPASESNPDAAFEQRWAVALIEQALAALRQEYGAEGKAELFEQLKGFVWGKRNSASYAAMGASLNLTEGNVKVSVHRLRQRFRETLRAEVAQTVARPDDVDDELRYLISIAG